MADPDSRQGTSYATPKTLAFVGEVHAPHDEALTGAFRAAETDGLPAIQVGPSEGKTLQLLLKLAGAKRVIEVGTLAGYSAIWMGRALPADGMLWTLEHDPRHAEVAKRNIERAGLSDRVQVVVGDGVESLAKLEKEGPFCAVFVDADKGRYDQYGRWAVAHLRPGGLLLGDNAFFFGELLSNSDAAAAMRRFHEEAAKSFDSVCLPTPDGLVLGIRKDG